MVSAAAVKAPTMTPIRLPRSAVWSISRRRSATAFVSLRRSSAISCLGPASFARETDPHPDRRCLLLQLRGRQLHLELDEGARVIGHPVGRTGDSVHSVLLTTTGAP